MIKMCEKCVGKGIDNPRRALDGERYCKMCRDVVLDELKSSGYLCYVEPFNCHAGDEGIPAFRTVDKRQAFDFEPDSWRENAVRHLEDALNFVEPGD